MSEAPKGLGQYKGRLSVCSPSARGGGLLGPRPQTERGDRREGAAPGMGGAQLVSGEPSLSAPRCFSRFEFHVSFSLWLLLTPRGGGGWAREDRVRRGERIPRRNPSPSRYEYLLSEVMLWGQVTRTAGSWGSDTLPPSGHCLWPALGATSFFFLHVSDKSSFAGLPPQPQLLSPRMLVA